MTQYIRCTVDSWDDSHIMASTPTGQVCIDCTDTVLLGLLYQGMQLNLLDSTVADGCLRPEFIVVEPDFLIDISSLAACFQDYGHHPFSYLMGQLKARDNSQAILLGNFAGTALDDIINQPDYQLNKTIQSSFREQALQFCTCQDFHAQRFKEDARQQSDNIREAVSLLFSVYDKSHALLEPSFVCERLGLQGRVDLMTSDMRLLVEQKSGRLWYNEAHTVQLLLYHGVLRYNFNLPENSVDIRLLYSKYPARDGLVPKQYDKPLFREAIMLRNRIVAQQIAMARQGFETFWAQLNADSLLEKAWKADFFNRYVRPRIERTLGPLQQLSDTEHDYVERMMTFVYREQLAQKIGTHTLEERTSQADLWRMPLTDKLETGNILIGRLLSCEPKEVMVSIDTSEVLPNFRRGDIVYLYRYEGAEPDVRANILYKGVVDVLTYDKVSVHLNEQQQNVHLFADGCYAVEHASSDIVTSSALRSILAFCNASVDRRQLLLGQRAPRKDASRTLSRSYSPYHDDVLLKACQSQDYFLLQGPPGTGKTSMALHYLVEEEISTSHADLLLTAYTNRAVDEICSMLEDAGIGYLRLGNEASCDPRFTHHLLDHLLDENPRLEAIRQQLLSVRVVVSTTSTLQSRPFLLELKRFALCIVDEASQILEPNIIGLLASESIGRFILIGDHKQLPAVVQQPDDEPRLHDCRLSLFERLLRQEREAGRTDFTAILRRQGRMHPDVAAFPNAFFYATEQLLPVPLPHQEELTLDYHEPSLDALDDLLKRHRVLFFPSDSRQEAASVKGLSDKVNPAEAQMVATLLRRIRRQYGLRFDVAKTVGVIVPYRNQIAMIRREIEKLDIPELAQISIDTVERYQGSQRDVIIYSFTVRQAYQLDFLTANCFEEAGRTIDRKLNVAMTRARKQLLMTGCTQVLKRNALFAELIRRYAVGEEGFSTNTK